MQRICSFTDVLFDALGLCAPVGRIDFDGLSSTGEIQRRQAQENPIQIQNP